MREYRLAPVWKLLSYLFCIGFLVLAIYWAVKPLTVPFRSIHVVNYIGSSLLLLLVYGLYREARYGKFIIDFVTEEITYISSFYTRKLPFNAIKGYRKVDNYLFIMPSDKKWKKIRISTYLGNSIEIEKWLNQNYSDLAELEALEDDKEIAQNEELGITEEARFQRIREATKVANALNTMAWVVLAWVLFYPHPYTLATSAGILLPVLTLFICYYYNGLMRGGDKVKSGYPSVVIAFVLPGMALLLRGLLDYSILSYTQGWIPILLVTGFMCVLYLLPTRGFTPTTKADYIFLFFFPFFMFIYSVGAIFLTNGTADTSPPSRHKTTVISKHTNKGKMTSYHLEVRPWGSLKDEQDVIVKYPMYKQVEVNDTITIVQRNGYWKMPWVKVEL